jgi:endogenous inhibitor of DNA gyrase (YacG/DUF329 family)
MSREASSAPGKPCPICGKPATAAHRPFCSARCADIDLGRWFRESYRIPSTESVPDVPATDPGEGHKDDDSLAH